MKEIKIGKNEAGKRLDGFLKAYFPNASMGFIYKMFRKKNITLNGKKASGTEKLISGDVIAVYFADETFDKFKGSNNISRNFGALKELGNLPIIYEDDNILLINKPAGVLTQKSKATDISLNDYLIEYLLQKGEITEKQLETYKPSVCNRLDRNTSGLVICAKSLPGARCMNELLDKRTVDKYYRTIVSGKIDTSLQLKGFLRKNEQKNKVYISEKDPKDPDYSYIETYYKPVSYNREQDLSMLEVKLITGKPHQIRAHLASIGNPIVGDVKYGGPKFHGVCSQLLHSYRLCFPKDLTGDFGVIAGREFIAELPEVFLKYFPK